MYNTHVAYGKGNHIRRKNVTEIVQQYTHFYFSGGFMFFILLYRCRLTSVNVELLLE